MHHSYVIQNIVDAAVMLKQAYARANDKYHPEATVIHYHAANVQQCNPKCKTIPIGANDANT